MAKRIYIETHGCQMNEADSRDIAERARAAGYTLASAPEDANVLVLNTCTVREGAERRAYGRIGQWKRLKIEDSTRKVVVMGCLAEQDKDRMQSIAPHVDGVFGTKELAQLGEALLEWNADADPASIDEEHILSQTIGSFNEGITDAYAHLRSYVTVQRGCSYYCTFCIVPHVRGRFDHRPKAEILAEVRARVAGGAREVMLVGQTVNAYKEPADGSDFAQLLHDVAAIDELERLTFVTSHPRDFHTRLIDACAAIPKLNPRFHLPMQSGSNSILRRMNRKYTIEEYLTHIGEFKARCPEWALTTDLIVGFPGETEEDFQATLEVCARGIFAQAYMFVYSPRRGTPAAKWEQVDGAVASERLKRLVAVVDPEIRKRHESHVGRTLRALKCGPSKKDPSKLSAKTLDNVTLIAPMVDGDEPWVDVRIERAFTWGYTGQIVSCAARFKGPPQRAKLVPATIDLIALAR